MICRVPPRRSFGGPDFSTGLDIRPRFNWAIEQLGEEPEEGSIAKETFKPRYAHCGIRICILGDRSAATNPT